ncbi:MAG: conjugal transfer protein TraX, partial [Oscillospiraceae bacterium]|nr:conjugal transfer protein TraX [Oscillospiraceae bacterium]
LALLSLVPIWLYRGRQGHHSKAFQYACYAFYPVHMLILGLVQLSL